jgi:hypothetical protein
MPRPRLHAIILLLLAIPGIGAFCQEAGDAQTFYVSLLRAAVSGSQIKISWKDPAGVTGENIVFRHTEEITDATIGNAVLVARIPMGVQNYLDKPPDAKGYFYAVLVEDASKKRFTLFIPFRNVTGASVAIAVSTSAPAAASAAPETAKPTVTTSAPSAALTAAPEGVTPFVSRLKAAVSDYQIKLTWKDSTEVTGVNLIFRHTEEITEGTIGKAAPLARVPTGVEYYIDAPPDEKGYFYAVLIEDAAKKRFAVFIPFRNVTGTALAVGTTATEEELATVITGIQAAVSAQGDAVELSFRSSNLARDLLVFWGTAPLAVAEDLLRGTSKTYVDPGVTKCSIPASPGVNYYFAVLDAGYYKVGKAPLEAGQNTTSSPARIPLPASVAELPMAPERRTLPLPALQLTQAVETGRDLPSEAYALPESQTISSSTEDAIEGILAAVPTSRLAEPKPSILESDSTPAAGGELASLSAVIKNQFAGGNYAEAGKLIEDFLSLRRKPDIEARAHFYLGQIKYFQNDTRGAVMEFLLAEDYFYHETQRWLESCFQKLESSDTGT